MDSDFIILKNLNVMYKIFAYMLQELALGSFGNIYSCLLFDFVLADCTKAPQGDQYVQESYGTNETSTFAQTHRTDAVITNPACSGSAGHRR